LSRFHLIEACEASLKRLGTDHIDLYQLHQWDGQTPLEETLEALDSLVRSGKVRYVGVRLAPDEDDQRVGAREARTAG
jgi:aryl-alcohol dehydrogenase-like predicted oxidoreductase